MNNRLKIFTFFLFFCLLPLKVPAADRSPFGDSNVTISMDFQDANLKDVVKILSIQSGLNFIASEAVQDRRITLFLDKVPIKEAMDKIFKANNLTYELEKEKGSLLSEAEGASGGADIVTAIRQVLSSTGKIAEDIGTNSLIITDVPSSFTNIEQVIAKLDIPLSQVLIDVEMLDVSKNIVDKMGFEFGDKPFTVLYPNAYKHGLRFIGNVIYRGANAISTTSSTAVPAGAVVFGNVYGQALDFLRTQTDTKYLARPRILTLNNESAEIYITRDEVVGRTDTTTTTSGVTTTTSTFIRATDLNLTKEGVGIFLRVTPQINPDTNEIVMVINPKSSATNQSALSVIGNIQSDAEIRATKSIVKVRDGETIVLGGLIHHEENTVIKKLPILGDIPFLGALFRHKSKTKDLERELIVFITPHIVKDTNIKVTQAKKTSLLTKEQITVSPSDRQLAIDSSLNSFEKVKQKFH